MNVADWIAAYGRAWEAADVAAAAALFTPDAVYRSHPFREPRVGTDGIRAYWAGATATQAETEVRFGAPISDGERVAVEWWATMRDDGEWITLPGCLLLRFDAEGLCEELREYWHVEEGRLDPPPGWGR